MGTRSLTFVYEDDGTAIINLYRQFDGYPEGHGRDLVGFLYNKRLVNGLGRDTKNVFNGMSCLAASLVAHFKTEAGGIYLHPTTSLDCGQDYEYHIYPNRIEVKKYDGRVLFNGTWEEFDGFCMKEGEEV